MEWISASEKMPPNLEKVIGYFPGGNEAGLKVSTAINIGNRLRSDFPNSTSYYFQATHWMPLPEPPNL